MQATISSISRIGESERVSVMVSFDGGSIKDFQFDLPIDRAAAVAEIRAELERRKSIEGQVANLQNLVGTTIK